MRISQATTAKINKPFYSDSKVSLTAIADESNNIVAFEVHAKYKNEKKQFPVDGDILAAWLKAESMCIDLK